jgi:hypothetical protein
MFASARAPGAQVRRAVGAYCSALEFVALTLRAAPERTFCEVAGAGVWGIMGG